MLSWFRKKEAEAAAVTTANPVAPKLDSTEPTTSDESTWLARLSVGLTKSTSKLGIGLADFVTKRKLDDAILEQLEEVLIEADLGPKLAATIAADFGRQRFGQDIGEDELKAFLADAIAARLRASAKPLAVDEIQKPFVILMTGVNGSGKTTTLGKLAAQLKSEGRKIRMVAGDTFRAAAVEQLQGWGARTGIQVIAKETGADAAGLAYEAYRDAKRDGVDVLLIDTAGRLQNKIELMAELKKIVRALQKAEASAPHATLLVLDATTGQNALSQVALFSEAAPLTGLVVTKLDGTAKGGIVVALADQHPLPIIAIGVGEGIADLQPFMPEAYAHALVG